MANRPAQYLVLGLLATSLLGCGSASSLPEASLPPPDDEIEFVLKPVMTLEEAKTLWEGKETVGVSCGVGVDKQGRICSANSNTYRLMIKGLEAKYIDVHSLTHGSDSYIGGFTIGNIRYKLRDDKYYRVDEP